MPEGDTVHKLANAMRPRLEGRVLARTDLRGDPTLDLAGHTVERVEARGKHLLITLAGDLVLRTHLGMHGSWHRYPPGAAWQRPERHASLVVGTDEDVFVCFHAKEAECVRAGGARARRTLARLGPDLAADAAPDLDLVVRRARELVECDAPLVDALLHQGVACGIGNVYKNELLFLHGLHPRRRLDSVADETLRALFETARRLLRANLGGGPRTTRTQADGAGAQWVYGRGGRDCLRCGTRLESAVLGRGRRRTVWCPRCQLG